jgi:hypothetical protein
MGATRQPDHTTKDTTVSKPYIVEHEHPEQLGCTVCSFSLDFDHYTVTGTGGPLCQNCANDAIPGLGDIAHGLSLLKWALVYELEHEHRRTAVHLIAEVGKLGSDLASGALLLRQELPDGTLVPVRPGGVDPHATVRQHLLRAVPAGGQP